MRSRRPGGRPRDERGATAVEFALVFCLVILPMIFGIVQYGYQYWSLSTADAAAREAARQLAVGTDWTCTRAGAITKISIPAVKTATPTVTRTSTGNLIAPQVGDIVTVRVQFDSLKLGFVPLPGGGRINRTAQARVENVPVAPLTC